MHVLIAVTHLPPPLHQLANDPGEEGQISCTTAATAGQGRQAAILRLADCGEAYVVLLDDGGVQAIEVQQQDKLVVQAFFGLQHQTPSILWGTPLLGPAYSRMFV